MSSTAMADTQRNMAFVFKLEYFVYFLAIFTVEIKMVNGELKGNFQLHV